MDWGAIGTQAAALVIGGGITAVAFLVRRGAAAVVADVVRDDIRQVGGSTTTSLPAVPHTPCSQPCDAHVELSRTHDTLSVAVADTAELVRVTVQKQDEAHREIFQRLAAFDQVQFATMQQLSEVRGQVGTISADVAYMSAKMGKKHDEKRIRREVVTALLAFVDDQVDHMAPLVRMIETAGFSVSTAKTYNEAHALIESLPFSFAVIDASLTLGEMEGIDLARWCINSFPTMRVYLYSGHELESVPPGLAGVYRKPHLSALLSDLSRHKQELERAVDDEV